jgi:hypothetical protein
MTEVPLPFLRNSERLAFKRCPAAWNWAWNMGLIPAMAGNNARWFGSCIHLALAEHYTPPPGESGFVRGRDMQETWAEVMENTFTTISTLPNWDDETEKEWVDAQKLGAAMLAGYKAHYGDEPHLEVLMPEQRFTAKIPYNKRQRQILMAFAGEHGYDWGRHEKFITKLVGSLDLPTRDHRNGHIEIIDHKTSGRRVSVDYLSKDDQIGTYISTTAPYLRARGLIKPDEEVSAVVFNFLKKSLPPDPETVDENGQIRNKPIKADYHAALSERGITYTAKDSVPTLEALAKGAGIKVWGAVSKNQGGPLFWREVIPRTKANRQRQIVRIADEAEVMARMRSGDIPIYKAPGEHCNWCDFKDLCDVDENGDDTEDFIKNLFKIQDPYADHREGAINSKEGATAKKETGVW